MMVEVKTLFSGCAEDCSGFDVTQAPEGWKCSKEWLCQYGANAMIRELMERFEHEEHEAYKRPETGLKEHAVWNKAIRILEEYCER